MDIREYKAKRNPKGPEAMALKAEREERERVEARRQARATPFSIQAQATLEADAAEESALASARIRATTGALPMATVNASDVPEPGSPPLPSLEAPNPEAARTAATGLQFGGASGEPTVAKGPKASSALTAPGSAARPVTLPEPVTSAPKKRGRPRRG